LLLSPQWVAIDFEKSEWRISATRMKVRVQHIAPMLTQAVEVLRDLQSLTDRFSFAFPSVRGRFRPMSENTINATLQRMGYTGQDMTGHGFRSMAATQ
jgi:integrase